MSNTFLIGLFVLVIGLILCLGSAFALISYLRKRNGWTWVTVRKWYATPSEFEEWMEKHHPSLEYEYVTQWLTWNKTTNKQTWRMRAIIIGMVVGGFTALFDSFIAGLILGACVMVVVWIFSAWMQVERLKDERKETQLEK